MRPREVCALQDSFIDEEGVCYVYEISVRHCDVLGLPDYVTADVMVRYVLCVICFVWRLLPVLCCHIDCNGKLASGLLRPMFMTFFLFLGLSLTCPTNQL